MILNAKKRNCCRISANANEDTKRKEYHASLASIERQQTPTNEGKTPNANTQQQIFIVTEKRKSERQEKHERRNDTNEDKRTTPNNDRNGKTKGTKTGTKNAINTKSHQRQERTKRRAGKVNERRKERCIL